MKNIPAISRESVTNRDNQQCQWCGIRANHWHHRRSRSIHDNHTHCACNGITLCFSHHEWIHQHPQSARELGFIVSRYEKSPSSVQVKTFQGWKYLECEQ